MQRNYRLRLYPTRTQELALESMLGAFCDLYNAALQERIDCYRKTGRSLGYCDQALQLKAVRAIDERLAGYSFSAEQQLLRRVDKAFRAFFARVKRGGAPGFPRFQAKRRFDSIEFRVGDGLTLKRDGRIGLTGLAGAIKVKWHREIPESAKLGHAVVSRNGGHWYVSFLATLPDVQTPEREITPVGIDLGVSNLVALSDGTTVATPQSVRDAAAKQRRHQRRIARRKKGSARWRKARADYARFARRVANQRRDFMHKLTTGLVRQHTHFAVEDLNITGLSRGMLAKDVLNADWSSFLAMLRYKAESAGGVVEPVDHRNTSQTCSACGSLVPKGLGVRVHDCPHCGYRADRDVNAAQNILLKSSFPGLGSSLRAQSGPDVRAELVRKAVSLQGMSDHYNASCSTVKPAAATAAPSSPHPAASAKRLMRSSVPSEALTRWLTGTSSGLMRHGLSACPAAFASIARTEAMRKPPSSTSPQWHTGTPAANPSSNRQYIARQTGLGIPAE